MLIVSGCFWRKNGELEFISSLIIFFNHIPYIYKTYSKKSIVTAMSFSSKAGGRWDLLPSKGLSPPKNSWKTFSGLPWKM